MKVINQDKFQGWMASARACGQQKILPRRNFALILPWIDYLKVTSQDKSCNRISRLVDYLMLGSTEASVQHMIKLDDDDDIFYIITLPEF